MSHTHDQVSILIKNFSEVKEDIMKKTMTREYNEFKFLVLENIKSWHSENIL